MTTIGIDLGTMNCVVAVPGHHEGKGVVFGPVTVMFDDVERLTQASAICSIDGAIIVGDDAEDLAARVTRRSGSSRNTWERKRSFRSAMRSGRLKR